MLLVKATSATGLFIHLSDYDFAVCNIKNRKYLWVFFHLKISKFNLDFKNAAKNSEKVFFSVIIPSELVSLYCPYEEQDNFHRWPIC